MGNILKTIERAGIVGCGGAGFPTHAKLNGKIRHLIVNGAECEPLLRTDRYVMKRHAEEIVKALIALKSALSIPQCTIALKAAYQEEASALEKAVAARKAPIALHKLGSFYPAGDEQTLVAEVTGRAVPPAGIPMDVGCVVSNVTTVYQIAQAMAGRPFTQKYLTVTGLVKRPVVVKVPIGTPFSFCLELAGGPTAPQWTALSGGPMMGRRMTQEEAEASFVTKTTSGIVVLPASSELLRMEQVPLSHVIQRAKSACIQCRTCTDLCPRYLLGHPIEPHRIMRQIAMLGTGGGTADRGALASAALCCECGICELYACPMGLQPRRVNRMLKEELREVRCRWPKGAGQRPIDRSREERKAPTRRAAARAGVLEFYDRCGTNDLSQGIPEQVTISLRQQIGAPAVPVVQPGDRVEAGELIAKIPEGQLSANLHASVAGLVTAVGDAIVITREG